MELGRGIKAGYIVGLVMAVIGILTAGQATVRYCFTVPEHVAESRMGAE